MTSLQATRTAVKTYLDTLKGTGQPFVEVYDYYTGKPLGYPFVMFEPSNETVQAEYEDTANNARTYSFDITVVQEMTKRTRKQALDSIVDCFDLIMNKFDENFTMGGAVKMVNAMGGAMGEADLGEGPCIFATLKVTCLVLYDIT